MAYVGSYLDSKSPDRKLSQQTTLALFDVERVPKPMLTQMENDPFLPCLGKYSRKRRVQSIAEVDESPLENVSELSLPMTRPVVLTSSKSDQRVERLESQLG